MTLSNTGAVASGTAALGTLPGGTWTVRCEADPNENLEDSNRLNNGRSARFSVLAPGVDMVVEQMELRDAARLGLTLPTAGNRIQIYAVIRNRLGQSAADMAVVCRRRPLNSAAVLDEVSVRTGPIAPNATKAVTLNISGPTASGPGHMSCIVDDNDDVPENDESNNEVGTALTAYPELPGDFGIELRNIQPWVPDPDVGHKTIRFEVVNTSGRGAAEPPPANVPHRVRCRRSARCRCARSRGFAWKATCPGIPAATCPPPVCHGRGRCGCTRPTVPASRT